MKVRLLYIGMLLAPALGFSQNITPWKDSPLIMDVKHSSSMDTIMVQQLFFSAIREKTIENFSVAAELFNRVLQTDPANDAAMYELAGLKKQQKNFNEAQQLLEHAVALKPNNEWYWTSLAECYEKNNDIAKLEHVFSQLIRINPAKPDNYFDEANALFIERKYDEALAVYAQIEALTGLTDDIAAQRQKIYLKQGKVDKAAAELEQMIADNPGQVRYYLLLSEIYNSNNLNDKALKVLQKAEKIDAANGYVHLALADIYRDKKDYEASLHQLEVAFAIPDMDIDQKIRIILGYIPKFPDQNAKNSALGLSKILTTTYPSEARSYAIYGDMLMANAKYKEARPAYKKSIELNDQLYNVHEQLVRLDIGDNDIDAAIKDGESTLGLFPNQAWMNYLVGVAWQQKKDYNKALSYIKNATSLELQDKDLLSQSFSSLGDCYHSLSNYPKSDEAYEKALTYNPDNGFTLNNYAYYLSLRGEQLDKAEQMAKHANELQPNTASFEDTYAWILFKIKKYAEAKLWIEKALMHDKDRSAVQVEHYGDIMFYLGNVDAAIQNWKKAKEYGGDTPVLERKINEKKYIE